VRIDIHLFTVLTPSQRDSLEHKLRPVAVASDLRMHDNSASCKGNVLCLLNGVDSGTVPLSLSLEKLVEHLRDTIVSATQGLDSVVVKGGPYTASHTPRRETILA